MGIESCLTFTTLKFELSCKNFEQGGLTGSVRADQYHAVTSLNGKLELIVNDLISVSHVDVFQLDDFLIGAFWLGEVEFENLAGSNGLGQSFEFLELLNTALYLGGFRSNRAKTIDELLNAFDFLVLVTIGLYLLLISFGALLEVCRIVASVGNELFLIDLVDGFNELIHEVAVVRNHQQSTRVVF